MRRRPIVLIVCWLLLMGSARVAAAQDREQLVTYQAVFTSTWSQTTHPPAPNAWPGFAHWSPLIGGTHAAGVAFWQPAAPASEGIESMAETGQTALLTSEINAAIAAGTAYGVVAGSGLATATGSVTVTVDTTYDYPLLTLVTMIAPSPDWFTGVQALPLQDVHGNWRPSLSVTLYAWDAGTDSGAYYTSANADTNPAEPIRDLTGSYPFANAPVGTLTLTRLQPTAVTHKNLGVAPQSPAALWLATLAAGTLAALWVRKTNGGPAGRPQTTCLCGETLTNKVSTGCRRPPQ